jgi:hypothetical protein
MKTINVRPVELIGNCRAHLTPDDEFQIQGMKLENPRQSNLCFLALSHFPPIVSQLQRGKCFFAHVACPDCLARLEQENRVVFLLGHADKWTLCQAISEYRRLETRFLEETGSLTQGRPLAGLVRPLGGKEPEISGQLRIAAIQDLKQGEYGKATQKMLAALEELKRAFA